MADKKRRKRRKRLLNRKVELVLHIGLVCAAVVAAIVLIARMVPISLQGRGNSAAAGIAAGTAEAGTVTGGSVQTAGNSGVTETGALDGAQGSGDASPAGENAVQGTPAADGDAAVQSISGEEAAPGTAAGTETTISDAAAQAATTGVTDVMSGTDSTASGVEEAASRADGSSPPSEVAKIRQVEEEDIQIADLSGDWRLVLVNPTNRLPSDYEADTCRIYEDEVERIDWRVYDDLHAMIRACENADLSPIIRAAYRTQSQQEELFEQKVDQFMAEGETLAEARQDAATIVALPGTSEHQLGLAVDIVSGDDTVLSEAQEDTPTQQWLMEHSWEYGFILRYPTDKSGITGIIYEPWHYRYVGKTAAKIMYEQNLCLEEYLYAYGSGGDGGDGEDEA